MFVTCSKHVHSNMQAGVDRAAGPPRLTQLAHSMNHHRSLSSGVLSVRSWWETQVGVGRFHEATSLQEGAGLLAFPQEVSKGQSVCPDFRLSSFYIARSLRPCRSFFLPTIMAVVIILLNLGTGMPWLASKKENYFLFPLHTPVAFNWMQSIMSPLSRQILECGLGQFRQLPRPGSAMNES